MKRFFAAVGLLLGILAARGSFAQSWTAAVNPPNIVAYNPMLLTDGTVIVQDGDNSNWWKLTPDQFGNYVTGTWTQLASPPGYGPLYYASQVMPDGRVFTMGGEYNFGASIFQNQGFIYDPVADAWAAVQPPSIFSGGLGDAGSVTLPNGKIMICDPLTTQAALYDPIANSFTAPYGNGKIDVNDEEGLTLLPNGTILTVDTTPNSSEIFNPATQAWTFAGTTPANLVGEGEEIGPQVLRPDGTVICFGGGGQNCIYNTITNSWSLAPSFPFVDGVELDCADAPACLLTNGNVLVMTSPGLFNPGVQFFEWDGAALNPAPNIPQASTDTSYYGNMLMLPNGQVMLTDQTQGIMFYNSTGGPNQAWAPSITNVSSFVVAGQTFQISGTQFNGLSTCSAYGDDEQNFTNYPIIRITNNATGHVFYCKEFNPSTMAICTGNQTVSTNFTVPTNIEKGPSTIEVVTNGIPSKAVAIDVVPPIQLTLAPTSVIGGASSTATLVLNAPAPAGGTVVNLTSDSANATAPGTVTVAGGATTVTFNIATTPVAATVTATISALTSNNGARATLTIIPPSLTAVSVSPTAVVGGVGSTGTVTLNGNAAVGGVTVGLTTNSTKTGLPTTVTVAAGSSTATFAITTIPVASATTATITATLGPVTETASLTVNPASLSAISVAPASVLGGASAKGTATMNGVVGPGGAVISLTTNSTSATTPSAVTVAAGATSVTFTVTTTAVSAATQVTVTGTQGTNTQSGSFTITPATLSSLSVSPSSVRGGLTSTGTLTLNGAAGTGGTLVTLGTASAAVTLPPSATVPAGATSVTFPIVTSPVSLVTNASITGTLAGGSQSATLTVTPAALTGVSVSPVSIVGGNIASGSVTLNGPAGPSGAIIALSSTTGASTPTTVTVPPGASNATFRIATSGESGSTTATITATLNGVSQTATLSITQASLASLSVAPNPVVGGNTAVGTVSLNGFAPAGGVTVTLSSINPTASVPATVIIPSGASSATFAIATKGISTQQTATINAVFGTSFQSATLTIQPASLGSLTVAPGTVVGGSQTTVTGTISFTGPVLAPITIKLVSSDPSSAAVPATAKIPAGSSSVTFTVAHKLVKASESVTITASYGGIQQTTTLVVNPFQVTAVTISPSTIAGGGKAVGTVTLNAPAGSGGGIAVKLSSTTKGVTVPASVTVPVGKSSATFSIGTTAVASTTTATIAAAYGGSSEQATLTIQPAALASLTVSPTSVKGGSTTAVTGTVTLTGPAPAGGLIVALMSSDPAAANAPATVTIAAGRSSATFKVSHAAVTAETSVALSATLSGVSKTANLTVNP